MDAQELAQLTKGVEEFRNYRRKMYAEYFESERRVFELDESLHEDMTPEQRMHIEREYAKAVATENRLEYLTDVLDHIWYGMFGRNGDTDL